MSCIFCDIVAKRQPAHIVFEDDKVMAFMDIMPVNRGHLLVIPRTHAVDIWQIEPQEAAAMLLAAQKVATALKTADIRCEGLNLWMANGRCAGQTVFHAHLHIVPRFSGDGFGLRFPPHYGHRPANEELTALADLIRTALTQDNP
jgi:histidine triad (HIT) family protein